MSKVYEIRRLPEGVGRYELKGVFCPDQLPEEYLALQEATLDNFPWDENGYKPETCARVGWNSEGLHVLMYANEPVIRAEETEVGGEVCEDSCLEFFLMPKEGNPLYFNAEITPLPTVHLGIGDGRHNRDVYKEVPAGMNAVSSKHEGAWWAVSYTIPAALLKERFDLVLESGLKMRGNFYKCGDSTQYPHYGMFHPYDLPAADYHRPELFADFVTK